MPQYRPIFFTTVFLVSCISTSIFAADRPITLKLGTLAPRGTSYHKSLQTMGEKWRQLSGGTVRLTIYPDGTQGGEADMVGLMQTGNLDAGLLTAVGLSGNEAEGNAVERNSMAFRTPRGAEYV